MSEVIEQSSALATIGTVNTALVFAPGGAESIVERIKREAREQAKGLDISSEKNRRAIISLAMKVTKSKTFLDGAGKDLKAEWLAKSNAVDAERRTIREELDALADEIRKPVTDWENAEKARIKRNEDAIAALEGLAVGLDTLSSDELGQRYQVCGDFIADHWSADFQVKAERIHAGVKAQLRVARQDAKVREDAEAAEAQRQAEEAERQRLAAIQAQKEREARIAAEAAEQARKDAEAKAERDRLAAEAAAQAEREAAARREQEAREAAERAEAARVAAEQRAERDRVSAAERTELNRKQQHEFALQSLAGMVSDAASPMNGSEMIRHITQMFEGMSEHKRDWQEYQSQYETLVSDGRARIAQRLEAVLGNEEERRRKVAKEDADRVERERQAAVEAERRRQEAEAQRQREEDERRAADKAVRAKINGEVKGALMACGLSDDMAKAVVIAIAKGEIPHVLLKY